MRILLILLLTLSLCSAAGAWTRISVLPGPLKQLEMDPNHPDTLFAVTKDRLYRSVDGGQKWIPTDLQGSGQIVIHPKDSRIYALFDEDAHNSLVSRTLWISKDQGASFQRIKQLDLLHDPLPLRLFVDRYHVTILYATDRDGRLMVSEDGGRHWRFMHTPSFYYIQIYSSPLNPQVLYISGFRDANYIPVDPILLISHDRGQTWKVLSRDDSPCAPTRFFEDPFFSRLLVSDCHGTGTLAAGGHKTRANTLSVMDIASVSGLSSQLFALQQVNLSVQNLLMSTNGGDSWHQESGMKGSITHVRVLNDAARWVVAATRSGGIYRQRLSDFPAGSSAPKN